MKVAVSMTARDQKAIVAKARRLHLTVSELMLRGALSYRNRIPGHELGRLADAARLAVERAAARIDSTLDLVEASNARMDEMERVARKTQP